MGHEPIRANGFFYVRNWIIVEFDHLFKSTDFNVFYTLFVCHFACDDDTNMHKHIYSFAKRTPLTEDIIN